MSKIANPTKVITGVNTRRSYANVWDPKSINGAAPKYSVSLIIPKSDTVTVNKIKAAIQAAYEEGESKLKGTAKVSFERICLSYWMKRNYPDRFCSYSIPEDTVGNYLNPASWRCTMIWSAYMGLPLSLEGVGTVLGLKDQKMKEGKDLIRYFCVPCKPMSRCRRSIPKNTTH